MEEWQGEFTYYSNGTVLTISQQKTIMLIQITVATLSLLGAGSTFLAMVWRDQVSRPELLPFFHLSVADLLAAMGIILSCSLYITGTGMSNLNVCSITTAFATGFYIVTFALTVTFALEILRQLKDNDQLDQVISWAYLISWTIYMPYFAIAFLTEPWNTITLNSPNCVNHSYQCLVIMHHVQDYCMETSRMEIRGRDASKAYFLSILIATFLALTALYYLIYKQLKRTHYGRGIVTQEQHVEAKYTRNRGILHCSVFIICWLPTLILGFITYSSSVSITSGPVYALYIVQAILTPSQGFMNSMVYGWSRTKFHRALGIQSNVSRSRVPFASWKNRTPAIYHTFSDYDDETSDADFNANRANLM